MNLEELKKSFETQKKSQNTRIYNGLFYSKKIFKDKLFVNSPTDTETYIKNHKETDIIKIGEKFETSIYNDTEYAVKLEVGEGKKYNYHKGPREGGGLFEGNRQVIYTGIGARVYYRTQKDTEQKIFETLEKGIIL